MAGNCGMPGGCDNPTCDLCQRVAKLPQPRTAISALDERRQENPERDGAPKLAGERPRQNLAFQRRRRVGPHR